MQKKTFISFFILALLMCVFSIQPKTAHAELTYKVENLVVSCIGDSIVYGYDPDNNGAQLSNNFPAQLAKQMGITDNNYGQNGYDTTDLLTYLSSIENELKNSDVIVMCIGANDILGPAIDYLSSQIINATDESVRSVMNAAIDGFENRYTYILNWFTSKYIDAEILLMNVYCPYTEEFKINIYNTINIGTITNDYLAGNPNNDPKIVGINNHIENISKNYPALNLNYVDIYSAFEDYTGTDKLVYANPALSNLETDIDPHPTEAGHKVIADTLMAKINEIATNNQSEVIQKPAIECTNSLDIFVPKFTTANIHSNIAGGTKVEWYVNEELQQESDIDFNFNAQESRVYTIFAKVNGIQSNSLTIDYVKASVRALTSDPDISNNNCITITFNYDVRYVDEAKRKNKAIEEMKKGIYSIFGQSNYVNVNGKYELHRQSDDSIKYYVLQSGAYTVNFANDIIQIAMPHINAQAVAKITSTAYEYTLGESTRPTLTFSFDGNATEKKWLWKTPERSAMEYLDTENNLNSYTIDMSLVPGVYQFVVQYKHNNVHYTSEIIQITVKAKPVAENVKPVIIQESAHNSKNNISAFRFTVTNIENIDPRQIIWRVNGVQQAKGKTFLFEPDFTDQYSVTAVINGNESNAIIVSAKIDNTIQKIIIIVSVVSFLSVLLAISIIISIKKEKIW